MHAPIAIQRHGLTWDFPLSRPHCGVPLGNGRVGLLIWGEADRLCCTVARAGFWDRRGGNPFTTRTTYAAVRSFVEAGDEAGLRAAFAEQSVGPDRPIQLGGGDLVCTLPAGWRMRSATCALTEGVVRVTCVDAAGREADLDIGLGVEVDLAWLSWRELPPPARVQFVPSYTWVAAELSARGIAPPQCWATAQGGGMCQSMPSDGSLAIAWSHRDRGGLALAVVLGTTGANPEDVAHTARHQAEQGALAPVVDAAATWWRHYAQTVATVTLPDAELQRAWDLGLLKQAGLTPPHGEAATLQGPFMESYQVPPWSNDYHFNINIEQVYGACLVTNCPDHLQPVWRLLHGWMTDLRANAERFFGAPEALLLPHAVDDRCQAVGAFWTGMIDQGCTAWMAQLAWQHYRCTGDVAMVRDTAWPLLVGAFNGFWAMIEQRDGRLSFPVSVSPEFGGCRSDAWGRDASFQLAACHAVARILPQAAAVLGEACDERWAQVRSALPLYALVRGPRTREYPEREVTRIGLWQDRDLPESHRHHSHLASLHPFRTVDPEDPAHRAIVQASLDWWVQQGAGSWSGWSFPWAASINARCGRADAAVAWLRWWQEGFTNIGGGTLHDADVAGLSQLHNPDGPEIMQMDAAMGGLSAIADLLVQCVNDEIRILPAGLPRRWRDLRFDRIRCEGAFLVGSTIRDREIVEVRVTALVDGSLRLRHSLGEDWICDGAAGCGPVLERSCVAGQELRLTSV